MSLPRYFGPNGREQRVIDYGANPVTRWVIRSLFADQEIQLGGRVLRPRIGLPTTEGPVKVFDGELGPKQVWTGVMGAVKNIPVAPGQLPNTAGLGAGPPMNAALRAIEASG